MGTAPITTPSPDPKLDLYKMEYELTAARYENIFKAIWQNFSYMTAISGAVLAFGGNRFQPNFLWFLVCLPLVFWFLATYLPLDRYGDMSSVRLKEIEGIFKDPPYNASIGHFSAFESRKSASGPSSFCRVRYVVRSFFIPLSLIFVYHACLTARAWCEGKSLIRDPQPEVNILTISPELEKLLNQKCATSTNQGPASKAETPNNTN